MSKIKSFRGKIASGAQDTIVLHTNTGSTGYRIVKFSLFPIAPGQGTAADIESTVKIFSVKQFNFTYSYNDLKTAFEENNFFVRDIGKFVELVNFDDGMRINKRNVNEFQTAFVSSVDGQVHFPTIDVYILSYDKDKNLVRPNSLIMSNLKKYLSNYRIITDEVKILNGKIINLMNFEQNLVI